MKIKKQNILKETIPPAQKQINPIIKKYLGKKFAKEARKANRIFRVTDSIKLTWK